MAALNQQASDMPAEEAGGASNESGLQWAILRCESAG
jgi:hypothetical protein